MFSQLWFFFCYSLFSTAFDCDRWAVVSVTCRSSASLYDHTFRLSRNFFCIIAEHFAAWREIKDLLPDLILPQVLSQATVTSLTRELQLMHFALPTASLLPVLLLLVADLRG